jgi:predicted RNase H-like HicB family nuclease
MNKFTIVFQQSDEGGFSAYIKEFPGAISEGESALEAANNVFDALVQLLAAQAEEQLKNLDKAPPHELELAMMAGYQEFSSTSTSCQLRYLG